MSITLPEDGQTDWGDELNTAINQVNSTANSASTSIASHAANNPADPHGDRAYAQSLVTPITTGVNQANGYAKLNSSGQLPSSILPPTTEVLSNYYDVVADYGAVPNTGADQSTHIQNALNAAASAGGGEVWIPAGTYTIDNYLYLGSHTHLHLSEGASLVRGSSTPQYMITNCQFGTNNVPAAYNIMITGGYMDATNGGTYTSSCTPIFIIQCTKVNVEDVSIQHPYGSPAMELNGCANIHVSSFNGIPYGGSSTTVPMIRLNTSSTSTTPSGLTSGTYNNAVCNGASFFGMATGGTYPYPVYSDLTYSSYTNTNIVIVGYYGTYTGSNILYPSGISNWSNYNATGYSETPAGSISGNVIITGTLNIPAASGAHVGIDDSGGLYLGNSNGDTAKLTGNSSGKVATASGLAVTGGTSTDTLSVSGSTSLSSLSISSGTTAAALTVSGNLTADAPVYVENQSAPSTPSGASAAYSSTGQLKYVSTDGNAYSTGVLHIVAYPNQNITSSSYGNVTSSSASVAAIHYRWKCTIIISTSATANEASFQFTCPSTTSGGNYGLTMKSFANEGAEDFSVRYIQGSGAVTSIGTGGGVNLGSSNGQVFELEGDATFASSGTLQLQALATGGSSDSFTINSVWLDLYPCT